MSVSGVEITAAPVAGSCTAVDILKVECTASTLGSPGTISFATKDPYVLNIVAILLVKLPPETPASASWRRRAAPEPADEAAPMDKADESITPRMPLSALAGMGVVDDAAADKMLMETCCEVATAEAEISLGLAVMAARLDTQFCTFSGLAGSALVRFARPLISWLRTDCSWANWAADMSHVGPL